MKSETSWVTKGTQVICQAGYDDEGMFPEPAVIIHRYPQDEDVFGIIQGGQEILIGGKRSLKQLAKALAEWAK